MYAAHAVVVAAMTEIWMVTVRARSYAATFYEKRPARARSCEATSSEKKKLFKKMC